MSMTLGMEISPPVMVPKLLPIAAMRVRLPLNTVQNSEAPITSYDLQGFLAIFTVLRYCSGGVKGLRIEAQTPFQAKTKRLAGK